MASSNFQKQQGKRQEELLHHLITHLLPVKVGSWLPVTLALTAASVRCTHAARERTYTHTHTHTHAHTYAQTHTHTKHTCKHAHMYTLTHIHKTQNIKRDTYSHAHTNYNTHTHKTNTESFLNARNLLS
jgi:hypothetical protein